MQKEKIQNYCVSDYAPFGALLAERSFSSENYPNSFNDKRDDPELGDWQDYGMRMYSTWQRRFPTPDPLIVYGQEYPWYSPYQFAGNKPIWAVDLDGLEELIKNGKNSYEIKGIYVVDDVILSKYDINDLEIAINYIANINPLSIISPKLINSDRVNLQFTISLMPMGKQLGDDGIVLEYDRHKDDRIWSRNGKSLGGVVKVGRYDDEMFIPKDGFEAYAYIKTNEKTSSNEITINPRVLDSPSQFPLFRFAGIMWHEKVHDMGLDHPSEEFPNFGAMSKGGGYPTNEEVKQLINPNGDFVTPSEELVK